MSGAAALPEPALELWRFAAREPTTVHVPPDGCRDLIVLAPRAGPPVCLVSALSQASETPSLPLAQARLGVSARSLERLLSPRTGRGPLWWRSLARARQCARGLVGDTPLAALASDHGYADQAHMTRDLRHWFGASPGRLRVMPSLLAALASSGHG